MAKASKNAKNVTVAGVAVKPRRVKRVKKITANPAVEITPVVETFEAVAEAPAAPVAVVLTIEEIEEIPAESCWNGKKIDQEVWQGLMAYHYATPSSVLYLLKAGLGWEEALREGCKNPHVKANLLSLQGKNEFNSFWAWVQNPKSPEGRSLGEVEARDRFSELWQKPSYSPNAWRCIRNNTLWEIGSILFPNKPRMLVFVHARNLARVRTRLIEIHG